MNFTSKRWTNIREAPNTANTISCKAWNSPVEYPSWEYHYNDVMLSAMASQITSLKIVHSTIYSGADQRKHQTSASLAFVRGIHRWPVNSPHKWPVTRTMFTFDDVIMKNLKNKFVFISSCWQTAPRIICDRQCRNFFRYCKTFLCKIGQYMIWPELWK